VAVLFGPEAIHSICFFNKSKLTEVRVTVDGEERNLCMPRLSVNQRKLRSFDQRRAFAISFKAFDVRNVLSDFDGLARCLGNALPLVDLYLIRAI